GGEDLVEHRISGHAAGAIRLAALPQRTIPRRIAGPHAWRMGAAHQTEPQRHPTNQEAAIHSRSYHRLMRASITPVRVDAIQRDLLGGRKREAAGVRYGEAAQRSCSGAGLTPRHSWGCHQLDSLEGKNN